MARSAPERRDSVHVESLEEEAGKTLSEARMVLPGMQALFGFQLIAVFNQGFRELGALERYVHLCALLLVTVGIALIMTPAIFHRIAERGRVSRRFIELASRFIACAMVPLALGIVLDLALVAWVIAQSVPIAIGVGSATLVLFAGLWFVFPWSQRRRGAAR